MYTHMYTRIHTIRSINSIHSIQSIHYICSKCVYFDIDIVVKTLLYIIWMISEYVQMKMEKQKYWESLETKQKPHIAHLSIHSVAQGRHQLSGKSYENKSF